MRTITNNDLKQANRRAYDNAVHTQFVPDDPDIPAFQGGLIYKTTSPDCVYEDEHGNRGAIGCALTSEEIQSLGCMDDQAERLHNLGVLRFEDPKFAGKLQDAHDQIVRAKKMNENYENRLKYYALLIGQNVDAEVNELIRIREEKEAQKLRDRNAKNKSHFRRDTRN